MTTLIRRHFAAIAVAALASAALAGCSSPESQAADRLAKAEAAADRAEAAAKRAEEAAHIKSVAVAPKAPVADDAPVDSSNQQTADNSVLPVSPAPQADQNEPTTRAAPIHPYQ